MGLRKPQRHGQWQSQPPAPNEDCSTPVHLSSLVACVKHRLRRGELTSFCTGWRWLISKDFPDLSRLDLASRLL